jgi:hypothetical protein
MFTLAPNTKLQMQRSTGSHRWWDDMLHNAYLRALLNATIIYNPLDQLKIAPVNQLGNQKQHYAHLQPQFVIEADAFRQKLGAMLGPDFLELVNDIQTDGVGLLCHFLPDKIFENLVIHYDCAMGKYASQTQIEHWFLSLKNTPDFLLNNSFNDNFFHPLLIAIIAYLMGGSIHIVDTRAKDTGPAQTLVRDNGPHRDDSPYGNEWKINISWTKSTCRGPQSQPFLAVTGYQDLERVQASEHGANFKNSAEIKRNYFGHPAKLNQDFYVMLAKDAHPITTIFHASHLLHQRYRHAVETVAGEDADRSCCILAFHRINKNSKPYLDCAQQLFNSPLLESVLQCDPKRDTDDYFLHQICQAKEAINIKIKDIKARQVYVPARNKALSEAKVHEWLARLDAVPSYEQTKPRLTQNLLQLNVSQDEFITSILRIMDVDKHYDLDCPIYPDRRELIRKQLRNQIREQDLMRMRNRPIAFKWLRQIHKPCLADFMPVNTVYENIKTIANNIAEQTRKQLFIDLAFALKQCKNVQEYRTTTIFIFWSLEELATSSVTSTTSTIEKTALAILQSYILVVCVDDYLFQLNQS